MKLSQAIMLVLVSVVACSIVPACGPGVSQPANAAKFAAQAPPAVTVNAHEGSYASLLVGPPALTNVQAAHWQFTPVNAGDALLAVEVWGTSNFPTATLGLEAELTINASTTIKQPCGVVPTGGLTAFVINIPLTGGFQCQPSILQPTLLDLKILATTNVADAGVVTFNVRFLTVQNVTPVPSSSQIANLP